MDGFQGGEEGEGVRGPPEVDVDCVERIEERAGVFGVVVGEVEGLCGGGLG